MTQFPDLFAALAAPFADREVKARGQAGRQFRYVTARTVMNRLDAVLGPENWTDDYFAGENSVLCKLTITLPDGRTVTKTDAGGFAGMPDQGDDDKSGYSDAFKRAAVKLGVGRYLYGDGVPSYAPTAGPVAVAPPALPAPEKPEKPAKAPRAPKAPTSPTSSAGAFYAWAKAVEAEAQVGILKYLASWAKIQDFPGRISDWSLDQVELGHAEAVRKLQALEAGAN